MATDGGARWSFDGELTMDTAAISLEASSRLPLPGTGVVDFTAMTRADSAALAVMIALKRRGIAQGHAISLSGVPAALSSLAVVYGIDPLLDA
ncbi:MAG: STAS domain-containing protein [Casimicrobiaceae bacterium]